MKKTVLIIFSVVLLLAIGLFAYSYQREEKVADNQTQSIDATSNKDVREVVWGQLSAEQQARINGTWADGTVSKVTLNESSMILIKDKSYQGKEVYLIDFPTKTMSVPNNMIVYADLDTFNYIGSGLVD